jgi:hypothetical protein
VRGQHDQQNDDMEELVKCADEIEQRDLYILRRGTLPLD